MYMYTDYSGKLYFVGHGLYTSVMGCQTTFLLLYGPVERGRKVICSWLARL